MNFCSERRELTLGKNDPRMLGLLDRHCAEIVADPNISASRKHIAAPSY
jgi:hypothetical protein